MPQKHENQRKHEEKTYTKQTGRRDTASGGLPDEITDIRDE